MAPPPPPSTLSKVLAGVTVVLAISSAVLGYYLYRAHTQLAEQGLRIADQEARIAELGQNLGAAKSAITGLEASGRDLKGQLSVLRAAMQQTTDIRFDASGAIITRRGPRPDGIELR